VALQEPAQDSKPSTVNRAKRDARAVPNLVFAVEAWERQLVLAGRAAKVWTRPRAGLMYPAPFLDSLEHLTRLSNLKALCKPPARFHVALK
jgi:hypothetical protein